MSRITRLTINHDFAGNVARSPALLADMLTRYMRNPETVSRDVIDELRVVFGINILMPEHGDIPFHPGSALDGIGVKTKPA